MKKILITGGSGFVGEHLVTQARGEWKLFSTYHKSRFSLLGVDVLPLDLEKEGEIRRLVADLCPDVVIHCAAWSNLDECEKKPDRCFCINAEATGILAGLSKEVGFRLIYTSTDMVFDGAKGDYCETDDTRPINVYGKAKLEGEEEVKARCQNYVIARVALVYGRPIGRGNSFSEEILNRTRKGEVVPLFVDQFRTPVFVQNLSQALLELAGMTFVGTIHLGGRERVDRYAFGRRLVKLQNISESLLNPVSIKDIQTGAPRPRDASFNTTQAQTLLKTELLGYRKGLKEAYCRA